jgi:putative membrane protein
VPALWLADPALPLPVWPGVNAALNGCATLCIVTGLIAVKRGAVPLHKACMSAAFFISAAFLVSYLSYHATGLETPYPKTEPGRGLYLVMLLSHILLAVPTAVLVPIVVVLGWRDKLERHRRWAKITAPLWLYVSFTGVCIYVWLYLYAGARPLAAAAEAAW